MAEEFGRRREAEIAALRKQLGLGWLASAADDRGRPKPQPVHQLMQPRAAEQGRSRLRDEEIDQILRDLDLGWIRQRH